MRSGIAHEMPMGLSGYVVRGADRVDPIWISRWKKLKRDDEGTAVEDALDEWNDCARRACDGDDAARATAGDSARRTGRGEDNTGEGDCPVDRSCCTGGCDLTDVYVGA